MLNRNTTVGNSKAQAPKERFILGSSECHFEVAQHLSGKLDVAKVTKLFNNPAMSIAETEGRSLKVLFNTGNEVKFVGFISAGDASLELCGGDTEQIIQAAAEGISKAITVDELINMF